MELRPHHSVCMGLACMGLACMGLACMALLGCGPAVEPADDGQAAGSVGSSPGPAETGDTSATGPAITTLPVDASTAASTGTCNDACIADFPCFGYEPRCVDESTIEIWVELSCEEVCGTPCCEGASCVPQGEALCPRGTWCVDVVPGPSMCLAAELLCGGPDGLGCAADELCEYVPDLCPDCVNDPTGCGPGSPLGVCVPRPAPDEVCPEVGPDGDPVQPQCGCDGVLYASECERRKSGVPWDGAGACG